MDDEGKTGDSVRGFAYAFTGGESVLATQERAQEPLDMGSRLELFVDDYLIESMDGVELKLHSPRSAGTALSEAPEPGASDTVFPDQSRSVPLGSTLPGGLHTPRS